MTSRSGRQLVISCGEPSGIGPDLCIMLAQQALPFNWVLVADPKLIQQRARQLALPVKINEYVAGTTASAHEPGTLNVFPVSLDVHCDAGRADARNAPYVLGCIDTAVKMCRQNRHCALVTAPVNKAVINDAGHAFSGHTEYLAKLTDAEMPVMLLATDGLRVALATTHLPLSQVSQAITRPLLEKVIRIINSDMKKWFGLDAPVVHVCGLNPHAGENGHLGFEEQEIITPVINKLKKENMQLHGPLSADTLFINKSLEPADVVLAMYHDQGLPVLKYRGFGKAANITLGLPIIRTSVDHGTALELAGSGKADTGSMLYAMQTAYEMLDNS